LLRQLDVQFTVSASDIAELHHEYLTGLEVSQINAYRKARSVAKKHPDQLVLAADTLVYLDTQLFGKPADLEEAYQMLERLQGQTHEVITAMCLMHARERRYKVCAEATAVTFRSLDASAIRKYLNHVNPLDKAGAYAIQEHGDSIVERISGSYTNVVGLPLERLKTELKEWATARG
jgi:septum formation protein